MAHTAFADRGIDEKPLTFQYFLSQFPLLDIDFRALDEPFTGREAPSRERRRRSGQTLAIRKDCHQLLLSLFQEGGRPCPTCLDRRWCALREPLEQVALMDRPNRSRRSNVGDETGLLTPFVLEAARAVTEASLAASRHQHHPVYVIDLISLTVSLTYLIEDSLCPVCAARPDDSPTVARIQLRTGLKLPPARRTRLKGIEEYPLERRAFVNPICGMSSFGVAEDYAHALTAPVTGAFWASGSKLRRAIDWSGQSFSYGHSLRIGIIESLERQAGLDCRAKNVTVVDTYANLAGEALNPAECGLLEPDYCERNPDLTPYSHDRPMPWVWGWRLRGARPILVPRQMAYYGLPVPGEPRFLEHNSNGCAAGSCLEEAILKGLLELIERDSFVISWFAKLSLPKIDPWSCTNPEILGVLHRIQKFNYDVHLLDARLDLSIPSVIAVAQRRDREFGSFMLAADASLDPEEAIRGALLEVSSYMMGFSKGVAFYQNDLRAMMADYRLVKEIEHHVLLYGLPEMADRASFYTSNNSIRSLKDTYPPGSTPGTSSFLDRNLNEVLEILDHAGMSEVIVVDQTTSEQRACGLTTVCTIVPGLTPLDFGYEQRRFLSVPRFRTAPRFAGYAADPVHSVLPHPFP